MEITLKQVNEELSRSVMAESVVLPIDKWVKYLNLAKFALTHSEGPAQAEIARLRSEVERLSGEYERGVNAVTHNLWRFSGSIREIDNNEEHNDAVLSARIKALENEDGNLNMTFGESEVCVERIRDTAWNDAIEAAASFAIKSVNEGGMARSLAFFVSQDEHRTYKDACMSYRDKILSLKRT